MIVCAYKLPHGPLICLNLINLFEPPKVIVAGDLNPKNELWDCKYTDTPSKQIERFTQDNGYFIYAPEDPTFIPNNTQLLPSTLDLAVSKNVPVINIQSLFETSSDHNPITFDLKTNLNVEHLHTKPKLDYIKARWDEYKDEINKNLKMKREFNTTNKIDEQVNIVTQLLHKAANNNIPVKSSPQFNNVPAKIAEIIKRRNRMRRQFQRYRDEDTKDELQQLNIEINTRLRSYWEHIWHQ